MIIFDIFWFLSVELWLSLDTKSNDKNRNEVVIAFYLANNIPIRKNSKPYSGCRVLDGTTSENDWIGFVKPSDLPRVINPKKGFIVTANNR
jgi:acyl-homoserine lactone acylase PvdQ